MPLRFSIGLLVFIGAVFTASGVGAQRGPAADPLVRENATVKLAAHTYVIPDANVGLVPNVGIVVGSRATLVIDPGLGKRNGETVLREVAKVSKNAELYIASTHFHPEHTTGLQRVSALGEIHQLDGRRKRSSSRAGCRWCRRSRAARP